LGVILLVGASSGMSQSQQQPLDMGLLELGPNFEVEEWVEERDGVELIYKTTFKWTHCLFSHISSFTQLNLHINYLHTVLKPFFPPELLLGLVVDSFPKVFVVSSQLLYKLLGSLSNQLFTQSSRNSFFGRGSFYHQLVFEFCSPCEASYGF